MKKKSKISITLSFAAAAVIMYLILKKVGFEELPDYIGRLDYKWIIAAAALYTIDMLVRAYRWKLILADSGVSIGTGASFLAYNLGNTMNILIPAKLGDAARSYYLKSKYGYGYTMTLPATFLDRVFDVIGVYILLLLSSIYVLARVRMDSWLYYLLLLGIAALIMVFVLLEVFASNKSSLGKIKNDKLRSLVSSMLEAFYGSVKRKDKFFILVAYSIFIWACEGIITYFVFMSLGESINPIILLFTNMVANLTKVIPITPGGLGVFEGTMIIVLSLLGVSGGFVGVASTLNHLVLNLYTITAGVYALLKENISVVKIQMEKADKK
ncbi:MAG: lysylphosphatidylglycerol synthase transmembrane domain-containing protein [Bacillota bacterium]